MHKPTRNPPSSQDSSLDIFLVRAEFFVRTHFFAYVHNYPRACTFFVRVHNFLHAYTIFCVRTQFFACVQNFPRACTFFRVRKEFLRVRNFLRAYTIFCVHIQFSRACTIFFACVHNSTCIHNFRGRTQLKRSFTFLRAYY